MIWEDYKYLRVSTHLYAQVKTLEQMQANFDSDNLPITLV